MLVAQSWASFFILYVLDAQDAEHYGGGVPSQALLIESYANLLRFGYLLFGGSCFAILWSGRIPNQIVRLDGW
jgi:hypothetical protein